MRIIRNIFHCPADCKGAVLALGNFDGVHLGHQAIISHSVALARAEGRKSAVMTFEPHPREFFSKDKKPLKIYSLRRKLELLRETGIDILFLARFDKRLSSTEAPAFIDTLARELGVYHVVTGFNFAFGKGRSGNTAVLASAAEQLGFGFSAYPPVEDEKGHTISSTAVREALAQGDMTLASAILGRPYSIEGHTIHGKGKGRELGFPTANLSLKNLYRPRFGIYAVRFMVERQKTMYDGVASLGLRPMYPLAEPLLEVHGLNMSRDLYGKHITVFPVKYLREEKLFGNEGELSAQMTEDCEQAKSILSHG